MRKHIPLSGLPLLFLLAGSSFAQAAGAAAATPAATASAAAGKTVKSAKAPASKPLAAPKKQHFLDVVSLSAKDVTFSFDDTSCFRGQLTFPAANASAIAKLFASETGFVVTAASPNQIALYYTTDTKPNQNSVGALKNHIADLATPDVNQAIAIRVPLDSEDKTVAQLTLPSDGSIEVKAVGRGCILVVSKKQADALTLAALKKTIIGKYGEIAATPPAQRLFYLDASSVATKLSGSGSASDGSSADSGSSQKSTPASSDANAAESPSASVSVAVGTLTPNSKTKSDDGGDSATTDSADSSDSPTGGASGSAGSDSTAVAGKKSSNSDKSKSASSASSNPKPPSMRAVNDMLVYSNDDGSDKGILERNRLMAILDLPRPEVLLNMWSLQASSRSPAVISKEAEAARELIAHHNDILQRSIEKLWDSLSTQMVDSQYFDPLFYSYVTQRFGQVDSDITSKISSESDGKIIRVATGNGSSNTSSIIQASSATHPSEHGSETSSTSVGSSTEDTSSLQTKINEERKNWGWCESNRYCLGYHAFEPLRPSFANILISIAAARDPLKVAKQALQEAEQPLPVQESEPQCSEGPSDTLPPCAEKDLVVDFRGCMRESEKRLRTFHAKSAHDCEVDDQIALAEQLLHMPAGQASVQTQALPLKCFGEQAEVIFKSKASGDRVYATTRVGLLRAAIADFLFNYKWAAQYPHDFIPYDLAQSAQELNTEFNPLVLAFNRDVAAFTENLQEELNCEYKSDIEREEASSWFGPGDQTFINDGILSVRGISGVESIADAVSQSFFDATNPPSLTDLVKSVSDAEKNLPGVLKTNLTANEAAVLLGALNSVQPAQAKIGRELKLDITPHSLPNASSAELEVKLSAQETGDPTRFTADKSAEDTLSRVAKHEVTTRVRVESLKLFEVSAFSAMLQRPRSKFPIVPPFFEVPYFGSFVGWPLKGAKMYHRSTAIISAVIVPTATDLAYGIDFAADRVCDSDGCYLAQSPKDFSHLPLRNFHKAVVGCLASGGTFDVAGGSPYSGQLLTNVAKSGDKCKNITFDSVPPGS